MRGFDQHVVDRILAGVVDAKDCVVDDRDAAIRQLLAGDLTPTQVALRVRCNVRTVRKVIVDDAARAARALTPATVIAHLERGGCVTRRTMLAAARRVA